MHFAVRLELYSRIHVKSKGSDLLYHCLDRKLSLARNIQLMPRSPWDNLNSTGNGIESGLMIFREY